MKIRKFRIENTKEIAQLIKKTFRKFSKNDGPKKAVEAYIHEYNDIEKLKVKFQRSPLFYIAEEKGKIIGIIRGDKNRVGNLFVLEEYHGQGVGKELMEKFEKISLSRGSKLIRIRSSLYAVPFYQKMGYKKSGGIIKTKNLFGLKYQPMLKKLK